MKCKNGTTYHDKNTILNTILFIIKAHVNMVNTIITSLTSSYQQRTGTGRPTTPNHEMKIVTTESCQRSYSSYQSSSSLSSSSSLLSSLLLSSLLSYMTLRYYDYHSYYYWCNTNAKDDHSDRKNVMMNERSDDHGERGDE